MTNHSDLTGGSAADGAPSVSLALLPERRLIGAGSRRHIDFQVSVARAATSAPRAPVAVGLVLDRSGSMSGTKMETARRAALAVLERLEPTDRVAAVVFDDQIDVLQPGALVTPEVKARLRVELSAVQARGSTALHEGWLTGCQAIAPTVASASLTRCFLLTDGLANVGLTDPEQIATAAAGVRAHAGVGTSTFGIGDDYAETLLGPMAVAGGGQFHHLRGPEDIARTFVGELGELLRVAALNVRIEIAASGGVSAESISPYWLEDTGHDSWSLQLGDLIGGEERHVIVRFAFHGWTPDTSRIVRARLTWNAASGAPQTGPWHTVGFESADSAARAAEVADRVVLSFVGQHHADRTRRLAIQRSRAGDVSGARGLLRTVSGRIAEYADNDPDLLRAVVELNSAERDLEHHGYQAAPGREAYFETQRRSRGQRDLRA